MDQIDMTFEMLPRFGRRALGASNITFDPLGAGAMRAFVAEAFTVSFA
jgi:hypothetical protein